MLDLTSFDAALKEYYTADKVEELQYKNYPFYAMIPKMTEFYGDVMPVPVYVENPQGRSANFTRAKTRGAASASLLRKFLLTRVQDYGFVTIDRETMLASSNDKGAFLKARTTEINGIYRTLAQSIATQLTRDGWGHIARVGSFSTTSITLKDTKDIVNFAVGQELGLAAAASTGAARAYGSSGNGLIVTAVDRNDGVLTFAYNVDNATNGIPAIANDDYIFIRGDRDESGSPAKERMTGLAGWIPDSDPSASESFFGVDRSVDPSRLAGLRLDVSGYPMEEALIEGLAVCATEGAEIDHYFMHPRRWGDLVKSLGSKVQYVDVEVGKISFRGVEISGETGTVKVLSDRTFPYNRVYGLKLDTWELASLKECPHAFKDDGLEVLRLSDDDGVEFRAGYYANVVCRNPGQNIVLKFS